MNQHFSGKYFLKDLKGIIKSAKISISRPQGLQVEYQLQGVSLCLAVAFAGYLTLMLLVANFAGIR